MLPPDERVELLERYYYPYRHGIEQHITDWTTAGQTVLHLSLHSFTPVWEGRPRDVDIGLLFDPDRAAETAACQQLRSLLSEPFPTQRIRFNEPYQGIDDGLTTYLRSRFSGDEYLGIELEINQAWIATPSWLVDIPIWVEVLGRWATPWR